MKLNQWRTHHENGTTTENDDECAEGKRKYDDTITDGRRHVGGGLCRGPEHPRHSSLSADEKDVTIKAGC